jgi:hypothetical protein
LALPIAAASVTICFFWLPYHIPSQPSLSDSFLFGFNNRACWLIFLAFLGIFTLFAPPLRETSAPGKPLARRTLRKALAGSFALSTAMYLWTRRLNGFDEAIYLIDRLRLLLEGKVPFRDFEYAYGPGFLYGPACLARLLHLGAADAYGIFFVLVSLLGTYLLYVCLLWSDGQSAPRRWVFLFLWTTSLLASLNFGVNYSLLRYDLPVFWMLWIHRAATRKSGSSLLPFALALLGYAVVLLDSPELAVAFALGSSLYLAYAGRLRIAAHAVAYAAMLLALAALSAAALQLGLFRTMLAFRAGGFNFPVAPAAHILLFLVAAAVVASQAGALVRKRANGTALPLLAFSLLASAAALGRCDPGHVLLDGLPLFLGAGLALSAMRAPWRAFVPVLWVVFVILPLALGGTSILNRLGKAALPAILAAEHGDRLSRVDLWVLHRMQRQLGEKIAAEKFAQFRAAAHREKNFDLDRLYAQPPSTIFEAPYGFSITHFGRFHAANVDEGYFSDMTNVVTPQQVVRKVDELKLHPDRPLLLLAGQENACSVSVTQERALISGLFLFPYRAEGVHLQSLSEPLCAYIHAHYTQTVPPDAAHFGYALWSPAA